MFEGSALISVALRHSTVQNRAASDMTLSTSAFLKVPQSSTAEIYRKLSLKTKINRSFTGLEASRGYRFRKAQPPILLVKKQIYEVAISVIYKHTPFAVVKIRERALHLPPCKPSSRVTGDVQFCLPLDWRPSRVEYPRMRSLIDVGIHEILCNMA